MRASIVIFMSATIALSLVAKLADLRICYFVQDGGVKPSEEVVESPSRPKSDSDPDFVEVPKVNSLSDDTVYDDVLSRQSRDFGNSAGRHVNVHETAHGIHSDLRMKYTRELGYRVNAFYCLKGRAVILREPNLRMTHIARRVPKKLRSYRYDLYFVDQMKDWDDTPTYPLEEWVAYILGSECAVEDNKMGVERPRSDAVSGCLDFSIYAVVTAMAVKEEDPHYWESHPEFRHFIKYNLIRAEKAFNEGREIFRSEKQEKLLEAFNNDDEDSKRVREFMSREFGDYFKQV
jgi:hypothetical protein